MCLINWTVNLVILLKWETGRLLWNKTSTFLFWFGSTTVTEWNCTLDLLKAKCLKTKTEKKNKTKKCWQGGRGGPSPRKSWGISSCQKTRSRCFLVQSAPIICCCETQQMTLGHKTMCMFNLTSGKSFIHFLLNDHEMLFLCSTLDDCVSVSHADCGLSLCWEPAGDISASEEIAADLTGPEDMQHSLVCTSF